MYKFAILDTNNICVGFCETDIYMGDKDKYLELRDLDFDVVLGKFWSGSSWEDCEAYNEAEKPLTEQEQIAIDTALSVEYMVCLMEANL